MVEIYLENSNQRIEVEQGTRLYDMADKYLSGSSNPVLGALVNNEIRDLDYKVYNPKCIRFFDITTVWGYRMYLGSMCFMLYKAVKDLYPAATLYIEHSMPNGMFFRVVGVDADNDKVALELKGYMLKMVADNIPFGTRYMLSQDALQELSGVGNMSTYRLVEDSNQLYCHINNLGDAVHKIYSKTVPSTGYLKVWDIRVYNDGYLLQMPLRQQPQMLTSYYDTPRLFKIFREHREWKNLLQTLYVTDLNDKVRSGDDNYLIQVAEALHEKKYSFIADEVYKRKDRLKMVLIAGPSSSGKTTSCRRIGVQLSVMGFDVQQLSLDDYFVDRDKTPRMPNGDYDFEALEALDIAKLNDDLMAMSQGKEVVLPRYDFITGKSMPSDHSIKMNNNSILIVEGIHALNPKLTEQIPEEWKYRVYVSAMTQIAIDNQNIIHSSDNRLIRRMVRDYNFRGYSALDTLKRWDSVRAGEQKHIFPYQENADVMFNSALMYEWGILKKYAQPLLENVPENVPEHAEARRLLDLINLFEPISDKHIPPTSIMREFLGESSFVY